MLIQMFPATLELVTNKSDAVQPHAHCELLVFFLHFPAAGAFLGKHLMVQGERQHDIRPDFPGVECAVEPPEFHRMAAMEETVQIEKMIAALMVVAVPATRIVLIPDGLYLLQCFWFHLIHPPYENRVHFLAIAHPFRRNLQ